MHKATVCQRLVASDVAISGSCGALKRSPPLCGLLGLPVADEGQHKIKLCHLGQRTTPRGVGYETHEDSDRSGCDTSSSGCAAAAGRIGMRDGTYAERG